MSNDPNKLENGSWAEWRRLVLSEISRLNSDIEELQKNQKKIEVQLATLSTKIIMYGVIGASVIGFATSLLATYLHR